MLMGCLCVQAVCLLVGLVAVVFAMATGNPAAVLLCVVALLVDVLCLSDMVRRVVASRDER